MIADRGSRDVVLFPKREPWNHISRLRALQLLSLLTGLPAISRTTSFIVSSPIIPRLADSSPRYSPANSSCVSSTCMPITSLDAGNKRRYRPFELANFYVAFDYKGRFGLLFPISACHLHVTLEHLRAPSQEAYSRDPKSSWDIRARFYTSSLAHQVLFPIDVRVTKVE